MRESREKRTFLVGILAYLDAREIKSLLKFVDRNRAKKKNCWRKNVRNEHASLVT